MMDKTSKMVITGGILGFITPVVMYLLKEEEQNNERAKAEKEDIEKEGASYSPDSETITAMSEIIGKSHGFVDGDEWINSHDYRFFAAVNKMRIETIQECCAVHRLKFYEQIDGMFDHSSNGWIKSGVYMKNFTDPTSAIDEGRQVSLKDKLWKYRNLDYENRANYDKLILI